MMRKHANDGPTGFNSKGFLDDIEKNYGSDFIKEVLNDGKTGPNYDTIKNLLVVGKRIEATQKGIVADQASEKVKQGLFNGLAGFLGGMKFKMFNGLQSIIGASGNKESALMEILNRDGFDKYIANYRGPGNKKDIAEKMQGVLAEYNKTRGGDYEMAVVSPTTGANSHKQIAAQYRFFDSFDNIIVCYDNDKAGKEATEDIVKALPKGKVKVMHMRYKDPNTYLEEGKQDEFIRNFYEAKRYTPVGVLGSGDLYDKILEQATVPKVPFPPFMNTLNEMLVGGLPLGHIINVAAGTGLGKTSFVNEMIYHWIFNSPHKIGIVSMELDSGQYGETLLGRHLSRKISLIQDDTAKKDLLESDKVREKANELFYNSDGQHRFYLLDNRDGTIEEIQDTVEELVVSCGCRIIVLDPLQDILDGLSNEDQALFMKWSKGIIKSHNVTLIFINHVRKSASGVQNSSQGGAFTEEEIQGSSTIIKSASANILLSRNKYAEDPTERNTTKVVLSKNRICGLTGPAGNVYYDNETHTLHNLDDWLNNNN